MNTVIGVPDATTNKAHCVFVTGGVGTTNGMAAPYYVGADGTTNAWFLNYTSTGFTEIQDSSMTALPASGGMGTELAVSSGTGTALTGDVNVWALKLAPGAAVTGTNTVTIGSGGLIMVNNAGTAVNNTANFTFGSAAAPVEAVIYTPASGGWLAAGETISGNITASGLTKGGPGNLSLEGNNTGLTGDIVINQGILYASPAGLGNASEIVINGGAFGGSGIAVTKTIAVGPMGGNLMCYGTAIQGSIVDDPAFGPGPLTVMQNTSLQAVNTWTGGLILNNCFVRMDVQRDANNNIINEGTPGNGNIIVYGPAANLCDYCGIGWTTAGRVSLLGGSDENMLSFEWQPNGNAKTWSFGSLEGTGDVVFGGYNYVTNATLQIGTDNTSTSYYGRIYEIAASEAANFIKTGTGTLTLWGDTPGTARPPLTPAIFASTAGC